MTAEKFCFCGSPATRECSEQGFGGAMDCGVPCCHDHLTCTWHGAVVRPATCPECLAEEPDHCGHAGYCSRFVNSEGKP